MTRDDEIDANDMHDRIRQIDAARAYRDAYDPDEADHDGYNWEMGAEVGCIIATVDPSQPMPPGASWSIEWPVDMRKVKT